MIVKKNGVEYPAFQWKGTLDDAPEWFMSRVTSGVIVIRPAVILDQKNAHDADTRGILVRGGLLSKLGPTLLINDEHGIHLAEMNDYIVLESPTQIEVKHPDVLRVHYSIIQQ